MTSAEIWNLVERQNAQGAAQLEDLGNSILLGKRLATQRQQRLEDVAGERQNQSNVAQIASQTRMKETAENERLMTLRQMAGEGIPVTLGMGMDEMARARRDFMTNRATTQLSVIKTQMDQARAKQQQAMDGIHSIASSPAVGTKEQRIQALRVVLNDPSSARLPDDTRAALMATVANGQDPAKQIDDALSAMATKYYGNKGTWYGMTPDNRLKNARDFQLAYLSALQPAATESQKMDLAAAMRSLDDANKQAESLNAQAYAHFGANAGFLPKDALTNWTGAYGHPQDPNAIMAAAMGAKPTQPLSTDADPRLKPSTGEPPAPPGGYRPMDTPASPLAQALQRVPGKSFMPAAVAMAVGQPDIASAIGAMTPSGPAPDSSLEAAMNSGLGDYWEKTGVAVPGLENLSPLNPSAGIVRGLQASGMLDRASQAGKKLAGYVSSLPGDVWTAMGPDTNAQLPPSPAEVGAFRSSRNPSPGQNPPSLVPANLAEKQQVELIVRSGLRRQGLAEPQIDNYINQANSKIAQGDPEAIASANKLLRAVRSAAASPLGLPGLNYQSQTNSPALAPVASDANDNSQ